MKIITISVDDELYRKSRQKAAGLNSSVARVLREYLRNGLPGMRRSSSAVWSCKDFLLMRIVVVSPVRLAGLTVTVSMPVVSVSFVDTNVLLYAVSNAAEEREKSRIARELLHGQVALSFQVLQEFYASATQPQKLGLTREEATSYCLIWMEFPVLALTDETLVSVLELVRTYQISTGTRALSPPLCRWDARSFTRKTSITGKTTAALRSSIRFSELDLTPWRGQADSRWKSGRLEPGMTARYQQA
jgi:predicted nucleic acid-binding protein